MNRVILPDAYVRGEILRIRFEPSPPNATHPWMAAGQSGWLEDLIS
jgi:hypothetical protein